MADAKLTALSEISVPALTDLLYCVADPAGTPASDKVTLSRFLGYAMRGACGFRLTTESGVAVSTTDRTAQSTLYLTPCNFAQHPRLVTLYDGTRWKLYDSAEISLALSSLTSGKNYDVFLYDNSGTLTLELSAAWTNDTTRADAIATQDGVYVKSGATTRRLVGTIRTTGTTTTEDSSGVTGTTQVGGKRFVWNLYNRVLLPLSVIDTTAQWTYATATIRQAHGASGNKVEYVCGLNDQTVRADYLASYFGQNNSTAEATAGVGLDSVTAYSGRVQAGYVGNANGGYSALGGSYSGFPGIGYHYLAALERGIASGTSIFVGNQNAQQTGLTALVWG